MLSDTAADGLGESGHEITETMGAGRRGLSVQMDQCLERGFERDMRAARRFSAIASVP